MQRYPTDSSASKTVTIDLSQRITTTPLDLDPSGSGYFCAIKDGIDPDPVSVKKGNPTVLHFKTSNCPAGHTASIIDFRYLHTVWYQANGTPNPDPTKWPEGTEFEYDTHGSSGQLWIKDIASNIFQYAYVLEVELTDANGGKEVIVVDPQIHNDQAAFTFR